VKLISLRQLYYFVGIAEHGSLSLAAQRLYVSQPALSQHVKHLEEELDCQLLDRSPQGVVLTEAGQILLEHARAILNATQAIEDDLREQVGVPRGPVSVGLPSSVGTVLSIPLVEQVRRDFPKIQLRITEAMSGHIQDWITSGSVDLGALYEVSTLRKLRLSPILEEDLFLVVPRKSWTGRIDAQGIAQESISLATCATLDLILPHPSHGLRAMIERVAHAHAVTLRPILEVDSLAQIKDLVARGSGYTILAHSAVGKEVSEGTLGLVPLEHPSLNRTVYFTRNPDRIATRAILEVERIMIEIATQLVRSGAWRGTLVASSDSKDKQKSAG